MNTNLSTDIKNQLDLIEKKRLESVLKGKKLERFNVLFIILIIIGVLSGFVIPVFWNYTGACSLSILFILSGIAGVILIGLKRHQYYKAFRNEFKTYVTQSIIKSMGQNYQYDPNGHVSPMYFINGLMKSGNAEGTAYGGSDLITKKEDDIIIQCSGFKSTMGVNKHDDNKWKFHEGLVFVFEGSKKFKGHTHIIYNNGIDLPPIFEKMANKLWDWTGYTHYDTSSPEFNRKFQVYTTNLDETQVLLTPEFLQCILEVDSMQKSWFSCAFYHDFFVIGLETYMVKFNPNDRTSIYQSTITEDYIKNMKKVFDIIEKVKPVFIKSQQSLP